MTWGANFSLSRPLFSTYRPGVCDRQTDVRQNRRLKLPLWGRRHNNKISIAQFGSNFRALEARRISVHCLIKQKVLSLDFKTDRVGSR